MMALSSDRFETDLTALRARGEPFSIATVVRTGDATSAIPGAKAIVLPDLAARFDLHRTLAAPGLAEGPAEVAQDSFAIATDARGKRFIVVATQGKGEEAGLRAALASGADHIAFVGSQRKFATVSERLVRDGLPADALARVRARLN